MLPRTLTVSFSFVLSLATVACGGDTTPGTCDLDFTREVSADFGNVKLDSLLESASRFSVSATRLSDSIRASCNAITTDLGGSSSDDTETACAAASDAIDSSLAVNASVTLLVEYVPAVCSASIDAFASCVGE